MSYEAIDKTVELMKEVEELELKRFPAEFVSKHTGAISRCLDDGSKSFSIRSGEKYDVLFGEPAFVEDIKIVFSDSIYGTPLDINILDSLNNKSVAVKIPVREFSKSISVYPRKITTGFSIYLHPGLFEIIKRRTLDVEKIVVYGYFASEFEEICEKFEAIEHHKEDAISYVSKERERVAKREDDLNQREIKIKALEEEKKRELEDLKAEIEKSEISFKEWTKDLSDLAREISSSESKVNQLNNQINVSETTQRNIDGEITSGKAQLDIYAKKNKEAEEKLKELTRNVNLFAEEFASFSDHGAAQVRIFICLSIIPIIIISLLTLQLLTGAVDLSVKYSEDPNIDLLTIFVTRIPYILVCGSIITACYSLATFLFKRISYIYAEKLDFSKISIIAKDVATASSNNTGLPDEHLYEARTYLKIEMLKSYLGGNIGQFTYTHKNLPKIETGDSPKKSLNDNKNEAVDESKKRTDDSSDKNEKE